MTPSEPEPILTEVEDPPVREGRLLTAAVCVAALALWFAAIWFIFGDMI